MHDNLVASAAGNEDSSNTKRLEARGGAVKQTLSSRRVMGNALCKFTCQ